MKDNYIQIRISTKEKEELTETAKSYGLTVSEYVRGLIEIESLERSFGDGENRRTTNN